MNRQRIERLERTAHLDCEEGGPGFEGIFGAEWREDDFHAVLLSLQADCWDRHDRDDLWPEGEPPRPALRRLSLEEEHGLLAGDVAILDFCRRQYVTWRAWWEEAIPSPAGCSRAEGRRTCFELEWHKLLLEPAQPS